MDLLGSFNMAAENACKNGCSGCILLNACLFDG
jgi:hypothetical protein